MITIGNPIFDSVFKFFLADDTAARILLSEADASGSFFLTFVCQEGILPNPIQFWANKRLCNNLFVRRHIPDAALPRRRRKQVSRLIATPEKSSFSFFLIF